MSQPISFRWDEAFIARIDKARGLVPRSAFVRAAVEQALGDARQEPTGSGVASSRVEAAPAERSSSRSEAFRRATQRKKKNR